LVGLATEPGGTKQNLNLLYQIETEDRPRVAEASDLQGKGQISKIKTLGGTVE